MELDGILAERKEGIAYSVCLRWDFFFGVGGMRQFRELEGGRGRK